MRKEKYISRKAKGEKHRRKRKRKRRRGVEDEMFLVLVSY
jgi:hypothetical protein